MIIKQFDLKKIVSFLLKVTFVLFYVSFSWADSILNLTWTVDPSDTSYQFLTFLFGNVSDDLNCYLGGSGLSCTQLVPLLFSAFNQGVLGIGTLVTSYLMFSTTASSAHEGEFLGKKNSSLWLPIRVTFGIGFLMPTSTGYSILQGFIMKVVLMGVAMANNVFGILQSYVETNNVTFGREQPSAAASSDLLNSLINISSAMFPYQYCYAYYQVKSSASIPFVSVLIPEFTGETPPYLGGPYFNDCSPPKKNFLAYYYRSRACCFD
jgi:hypothetical protein